MKKKTIIITITLLSLFISYWFLFGQYDFSEYRAKTRYREDKKALLKNWKNNSGNITKVALFIKRVPYIQSLFITNNNEISIRIGNLMGTSEYIFINETEDFFKHEIENIDINKYTYEYVGSVDSETLKRILNKAYINNSQIDSLRYYLKKSNCFGVKRYNTNETSILYSGSPWEALEYVYINGVNFQTNKLNKNFSWRLFNSGLICSAPWYIEEN